MKRILLSTIVLFAFSANAAVSSDTYRKMTFQEGKEASQIKMLAGSPDASQSDYATCNDGKRGFKELWIYRGDESLRGKSIEVNICAGKVVSVRQQ